MDSIRKENFVTEFVGLQSGAQLTSQFSKRNEKEVVLQNRMHYAASRKVAGSSPDEVDIFSIDLILPPSL
jgi:hypothetical protein